MKFLRAVLAVAVVLTFVFAGSAYAAIGIYKASATPAVPCSVSYMLNRDADDTSSGWSVKIEITPAAGGPAVRTWTFTYPDPLCAKGMHTGAVVWDGMKDDGSPAPPAQYKISITAKAAPVTGNTLKPIWESTDIASDGWRDAAINTVADSPYYGYVYAANAGTHDVYVWAPDGTPAGTFTAKPADGWFSAAPWGVDVDGDGTVYASSYSKSYFALFTPDGTGLVQQPINASSQYKNPRFFAVTGSGQSTKTVATYWQPTAFPPTNGKLYTSTGEPPSTPFLEIATLGWPLMEPEFDSQGYIHVPAYADPSSACGGALVKYDMNGNMIARNNNIRRGTGLAISPGEDYIWIARNVGTDACSESDTSAIYKIPMATAYTAAPYTGGEVTKLGIDCTGPNKRAYTLECDAFGNLVAAAGDSNAVSTGLPNCTVIGLYEPPDSGSVCTTTVTIAPIVCNPRIIDCPQPPYAACANGTVTIAATVEDCENTSVYNDIASCRFACAGIAYNEAPMNLAQRSGTQNAYQLAITVPAGTHTGSYTGRICAYSVDPTEQPACCDVIIDVCAPLTSLGAARAAQDGPVCINCAGAPLVVTHVDSPQSGQSQGWFYVEAPDRSAGIKVTAGSTTLPRIWPGYTVAALEGLLTSTTDGRELSLQAPASFLAGPIGGVPAPVAAANLAIGGSHYGGTPGVTDRGAGLNSEGLLVRVWGRVTDIRTDASTGAPVVFIDDGSAVQGALAGTPPAAITGLKCCVGSAGVPPGLSAGDYVVATGISGSEWIGSTLGRIRCIRMRHCQDAGGSNPTVSDEIRIVEDRQ